MRVVTLLENRTVSSNYKSKHGLSLYIETEKHKILFDTGANDYFATNAQKLGVDLKLVDIAIISHGHDDHGGALETFMAMNQTATIYTGTGAFDSHLLKVLNVFKKDIGLKVELQGNKRIKQLEELLWIDEEVLIFTKLNNNRLLPKGNNVLLEMNGFGEYQEDRFTHEINLVIKEGGKAHLFCGCAHRGIVNIVDQAKLIVGFPMTSVIGGFHLMHLNPRHKQDQKYLEELCKYLVRNETKEYYTCHCTGEAAYNYMHKKVDHIQQIKTGTVLEL